MRKQLLVAYLWNSVGKLVIRGLGLISTLILVRLLSPEDFGLVAIATAAMGLFFVFSEIGPKRYLIAKQINDPDIVNTAWTLRIILNGTVIALTAVAASTIAEFYGDSRLSFVLYGLCVAETILLFSNIGLVLNEQSLDYKTLNKIDIVAKVMSFFVTIWAAFVYKDYTALVYGYVANYAVKSVFSYVYCGYRPRLKFKLHMEMLSFSGKLITRNIAGYLRAKSDIFFIGYFFNTSATGKYSVSQEFAILPQTEIISPSVQPMFATVSKSHKTDKEKTYLQVYKYLAVQYSLIIPSIVGIIYVAPFISNVVLGEKWSSTTTIIQNLAFLMLPFSLQPVLNTLYDLSNKGAFPAIIDLLGIMAIVLIFLVINPNNIELFSEYRAALAVIIFLLLAAVAHYLVQFSFKALMVGLFIPIVASALMAAFFEFGVFFSELSLLSLLLNVALGGIVYAFSFWLLCTAFRPHSIIISFLYDLLAKAITILKSRTLGL